MKVIRDPVHGYIEVDRFISSLIDTPRMQRLRRIKQLGLSDLVYPGANHTRFEHSLGVMHLATTLAEQIDSITTDEKNEMRVAGLLHDIGHGPLSHVTEGIIKQYTRKEHEDVRHLLKKGRISEILNDNGLDPTNVCRHIKGETSLGQIINGEIDVDRMDYLIRDSHYTGVAFGLVDHTRLLHEMQFYEDKLVVGPGGLKAAESLLVSRFLMHPSVYYHHVSRIAETMFTRAVKYLINEKKLDPFELKDMVDPTLHELLRADRGYAGEIAKRLDERRLYKRALYVGFETIDESVLKYRGKVERVETEIADMVGIDKEQILIDIPKPPEIPEMRAMVKTDGKMLHLDEASHIVATLEQAHRDNWKMGVYTVKEHREAVNKASNEFFDTKKRTKQFRLSDL